MANVRREFIEQRREEVMDCFRTHGSMTYAEVAKALEISYNQARDIIAKLVKDGEVRSVKMVGKTIYFGIEGGSKMPSLLGSSGFVNVSVVVRRSIDHRLLPFDFNAMMGEVLAIFYSQPLLAKVSSSISDDDMIRGRTLLSEMQEFSRTITRIADEMEAKLIPADPPVGYYDWADDPQYDKELAIRARQKYSPDGVPEYVVNAYRMLVGESAGITPLAPDTDSTDES